MAETASEKAKKESQGPTFMGRGRAVLTIRDFHSWKAFFTRDDQELSEEFIETIEQAADASYDNYSVEGKIRIEWPEVFLDFNMDRFLGIPRRPRGSKEKPIMITASQNFATIIHPFAIDKEWFKGLNSKDVKKFSGYEWMFEQNKDNFLYKGQVRRGSELFVTFEFGPDRRYHKYQGP